jgi:dihydroxyacetone kinase DhaKLM complex PTS-EIIA-like component DhaM
MAMNIPGELAWVLDMLGYEWPELDEDEIRRAAVIVRQFKEDLEGSIEEANKRVNDDVTSALSAQTAGAYTNAWNSNRETHMQRLVDLLDPAADGIDLFADAVVALKVKVIAELTITAAQIAAAAATAIVTLGASAAANAAIIAARKKALDIATDIAVEQLAIQLMELVTEPLTNVAVSIASSMLDAPIVEGALGEAAEYKADLEALEQTANDMERTAQDQERLGQDFIAQISALQISTGG